MVKLNIVAHMSSLDIMPFTLGYYSWHFVLTKKKGVLEIYHLINLSDFCSLRSPKVISRQDIFLQIKRNLCENINGIEKVQFS